MSLPFFMMVCIRSIRLYVRANSDEDETEDHNQSQVNLLHYE
jgi:hypothetical protein